MNVANGTATAVEIVASKWTPGTYANWSAVILQAFIVLALAVKIGPSWWDRWITSKKQEADIDETKRAALAAERAAEETKRAADKMAVNERMDQLEERMARMGQAMSFLMNAAITSTNALEAAVPGSPAIKQSRELIGYAASAIGGDDPFGKALLALAGTRGVGE